MALTTLAKLKSYLGVADAAQDTVLTDLLASAERKCKDFLHGRELGLTTYTDQILNGSGMADLRFPHWPLVSVSEIRVDGDRTFGSSTILVADDDYVVDLEAGIVERVGGEWLEGLRVIKATYSAGYDPVPMDVQEAVWQTAAASFRRHEQVKSGQGVAELAGESIGGGRSESYREEEAQGIPRVARQTLLMYRA